VRRTKGEVPPDLRSRLTDTIAGRYPALTPEPLLPPWKSTRIDNVEKLQADDEVKVTARHRLADGSDYHMCWWLKYGPKGWRYFDWEDRELDERFSADTPEMPKMSAQDIDRWFGAARELRIGEEFAKRGEIDMASAKLARIALIKLPPVLDAHRWLLSGIVALRQSRPERAITDFGIAEELRKRIPYTDRLRASAYLALGESGQALASLASYTQRLGDDPTTARDRGVANAALGLFPTALEFFRESLQDFPGKDQRAGPIKTNGAQK